MKYSSLDFQITRSPEASSYEYRASILEDGNVVVSNGFELRQDLKLSQILESIEKKVTKSPEEPDNQKENAELLEENEREKPHIEFGKMLYSKVFSGQLGEYFNKSVKEVPENSSGLRISLRFGEDVPEISALPWEYLHDDEDFLIRRRNILISRLPAGVKRNNLEPLDSVLRMLVIISGPDDPRISPLNTEKEQEIILEAVDKLQRDQKIKVDFTEDATFENVEGYLNEQDYHIIHFTGHGISIDGKGNLVFENEGQKARLIDNKTLSDLFSERGIRLVVLSSCESAKGSNKKAFGDLASMLSKKGIPAVVAMQYSVLDDVATKFAYNFYRAISSGKPVDLALKEARLVMKNLENGNGLDFATPVLYLSDCNCVNVGNLKPETSEFVFKPMMLPDLQVMEKGFVARRKELRLLEKGFKSDVKRAAIIHGFGGIGKTVLATRFALKMGYYFEGTLGIKFTPTTRPEDILNKFNNFLLMKGRPELNQILNQQVPLEVKTTLLVEILKQIRFLVIFDNFEDCLNEEKNDIENLELKAFIQHLLNNTTRNTKFLITTRYDFDPLDGRLAAGIEHISLPELHFPQTNWLMNNFTELADMGIQKKRKIYDVIGGHPWTIGQFAKHAAVQGVDDLLLDLSPLKKDLIEFTLLDKSFSKLDEDARKLLLCASIYEEAIPVEALSWIIGDEKDEGPSVGETLQKLIQWGLISKEQEYDNNVYSEHTIVKDFARKKLKEDGLDKKKLLIRAARYYENMVSHTGSLWDHLRARDYYFRAEDWESASEIVENAVNYLIRWGYIGLAMDLLNESTRTTSGIIKINSEYTLATIFRRLGDVNTALKMYNSIKYNYEELGNKREVAVVLHAIGMIHQDQGSYEEAVEKYNQALKAFEELGDKSAIAATLHALGNIHKDKGNSEKSEKKYNQALKAFEELGDKSGVAYTLSQLGMIHQDQGNYEEAVNLYNQSLKIKEELGDKSGIATTLHQLGSICYLQGDYEEAVNLYNQALNIEEELGKKSGIAYSLHALGTINQDQGNYEEAVNLYNQSLKIKEELGDKSGIATTLHQLGSICYLQGDYEEAVNKNNQSLKIEEKLGDKHGIAQTLHNLGMIHQDQGNYEEAVNLYNQSLKIEKELGDKYGIAQTLHQLGNVHYSQGNYEEAMNLYNQSLKIKEELGDKSGIAVTLGQIGRIHEGEGECICALRNYLISFSIFEQLNSPNKEIVLEYLSRLRDIMGKQEFDAEFERLGNE
ncbi:MAG TPA: tetratricopeptide repeat protein [Methanosarcina sp.]|nr:tetratricopeptide repeat protein [Methanosarcina sp.]